MTDAGSVVGRLRNTPVRELVSALERDGFALRRSTRSGGRVYAHPDGRIAVVHYHHGSDTLPRGTLRSLLAGTRWAAADLERLGLL